jgi:hypothetical protein
MFSFRANGAMGKPISGKEVRPEPNPRFSEKYEKGFWLPRSDNGSGELIRDAGTSSIIIVSLPSKYKLLSGLFPGGDIGAANNLFSSAFLLYKK